MGQRQTELGEGDWLVVAEAAYNAWHTQMDLMDTAYSRRSERTPWQDLDADKRSPWVASVKETYEKLRTALVRIGWWTT